MWLVILALAATIVTPLWYSKAGDDKFLLKLLTLILWGTTIMVFIDHVMGYLTEGGEFLEMTAEATVLGFCLLAIAFTVWEVSLLLKDPRCVLHKKKASQSTFEMRVSQERS